MAHVTPQTSNTYVLGHSEKELNRLIDQGRFFGDLTEHVLQLAGLRPGMRVLDIGCGVGDVAFLAARIVGPYGAVIGVDKSPEAIDVANQRAAGAGITNVSFLAEDINDLTLTEPVDALIGRLVLMYFADPAVVLRRLVQYVKPGGIVVFHELDAMGATSEPRCELFETTIERIRSAFAIVGADVRAGLKLGNVYREAGLPEPQMILGARVERGAGSAIYDHVTGITRTLLPLMQQTGIATAAEVDIDTLAGRLRDEAASLGATLVSPTFVGAWVCKT